MSEFHTRSEQTHGIFETNIIFTWTTSKESENY